MLLFAVSLWTDGLACPPTRISHFQRRIAVNNAVFECGIKDGSEIIRRVVFFETLRRLAVGVPLRWPQRVRLGTA